MKSSKKHSSRNESDPPPSILLAEDDLEMRKMLSWSLERKGYEVIECADGTTLMRKLGLLGPGAEARPHDLIISDIRMPGVSGLQVLESVREYPDFPPMILITAFPDNESREQAMRLGAVAMMAKPFDVEELLQKVAETITPELTQRRSTAEFEDDRNTPFPLEITFRHDSGSDAAKNYIRSLAMKLHPYGDHVVHGRIIIDHSDKTERKKHRYMLTLVLSTSGRSIVVKHNTDSGATDENLYMAMNVVFGTASRKLKRYVKKQQDRRKHSGRTSETLAEEEEYESEQLDTDVN
ncbi:MAG: response regulator [bacterium]